MAKPEISEEKKNKKPPAMPPRRPGIAWPYLLLLGLVVFMWLRTPKFSSEETTWLDVQRDMVSRQAVSKIEIINNEKAEVYLKESFADSAGFTKVLKPDGKNISPGPHYTFTIGSPETLERKLDEAQKNIPLKDRVEVTYKKESNWFLSILGWIIPLALLFFLWSFMLRRAGGGGMGGSSVFSFGKSKATLTEHQDKDRVTFRDVAGLEEAQLEVKEVIDFLKNPDTFTRLGAKIPKGVILVGPPGTGKTLLAKAVAGEAEVPFFSMSGSEFVEMFVGVGASRVRDLFKQAKAKSPCIVFIDEIDSIGQSRGRSAYFQGANDERESTLNQLLTEMDGFETNSGVIVLAATNRAEQLDPALLRPGRFDRHIYLELPNLHEREAIFKVHLRPIKYDKEIDLKFLAAQTPGFSGADIANACNEAALIAARNKKDLVTSQDFLEALDRIIAGLEKKSKVITPEEKRIIAFHEAGHAVVSWKLEHVDPLVKISIIPRGKSLGAAWYLPEERQLKSFTAFKEHMAATLGGRAAEDLVFGEVTSGALDDLEKVTKEAYMLVAYYGFDKQLGNISFYDSSGQQQNQLVKPYSEETGKLIDSEVRKLVEDAYKLAKNTLSENRDLLNKLADTLLAKEVILKDELQNILGSRPKQTPYPES